MKKIIIASAAIGVAVLGAGACGSQASTSTIPVNPVKSYGVQVNDSPSSAASAAPVPSAASAAAAPSSADPACGQQVSAWLAEQDGTGITGNTMQHDISAILFDATAYRHYDPSDTGAGQNFLTGVGAEVTNSSYTTVPGIPPCADPQGLWGADLATSGTFLYDAQDASNDTAGTSQADSDVAATISDFAALNAELKTTAGVQMKGLPSGSGL
jgi:hypothetical protein